MNIRKSIGIAAASLVLGGMLYWVWSGDEAPVLTDAEIQREAGTIADKWQWNSFTAAGESGKSSEVGNLHSVNAVPDYAVRVYKIVQSIKLDENGRVIPDQWVREALEEGFEALGPDQSPAAMEKLQDLIRTGLPGPAGNEAAQILGNYYQFRLAEQEFNRQSENQLPVSEVEFNRRTDHQSYAADRHQELVQLRRNFFGAETADKLFAVEDTQARHMLAAIAVQQDPKLTAAEKQAKQATLQDQLNDRQLALGLANPEEVAAEKVRRQHEKGASTADIYSTRRAILGTERASELAAADREEAQWQSSFNGYWQARRYVMQAGLDDAERERQIEQLLNQYFNSDERERARITSIDWQARDQK